MNSNIFLFSAILFFVLQSQSSDAEAHQSGTYMKQQSTIIKTSNTFITAGHEHTHKLEKFLSEITDSKSISSRQEQQDEGDDEVKETPEAQLKGIGYSFDFCETDDDCVGDRLCLTADRLKCDSASEACFCFPIIPKDEYAEYNLDPTIIDQAIIIQNCTTCAECDYYPDESCVRLGNQDPNSSALCASVNQVRNGFYVETDCDTYPEITPYLRGGGFQYPAGPNDVSYYASTPSSSPSPFRSASPSGNDNKETEDSGCIAVHSLTHIHKSNLVFEKHRLANVYCDQHNSCATPGHMVVYNGNAMSMKTYCETLSGECTKDILYVNSPKFSAALRIKSLTENLHFTSFSATYNTKLEEVALRSLIYLGL